MKTQYRIFALIIVLAAITGLALAMNRPAAAFEDSPIGYASMNGGTTGGAGGTTVTVTSGAALQAAIDNKGSQPLIIYVQGRLTHSAGRIVVKDVSGISIIGVGSSAELDGFGLSLRRASNIIIRNLKIHHVDRDDKDAIQLNENVTNVWIDHNELYSDLDHDKDYYDGLLDISHASDYITISWNVFHTHYKTSLIGNSDSNASEDQGHFLVTYHHNYFYDVNSRTPSNRFGRVHLFNNYYRNISTGVSSRMGACTRIERNVFENVSTPVMTDQSSTLGSVQLIDNQFVSSGSYATSPTCSLSVPYSYSADAVSQVASIVTNGAGVGKLGQTPPPTTPPPTTPPPTTPPPTTPPPTTPPGVYQAENATLGGGVTVDTNNTGFFGTGFVNFPSSGGYVEFRNVDGGTGGSRTLRFRNALGVTSSRTGQLTVNGAGQNITFSPTGSWTTWAIREVAVNLNAGATNTIRLASTGQDLANLDQLEVAGGTPPTTPPPTTPPPTTPPPTTPPPTTPPPTTPPPTTTVPGTCSASYVPQNDWGSGATINVTIRNNGTSAINGWTLTWTFPGNQQIVNLWNGSYSQSGASVTVRDGGWNATIGASGGTASFGFNLAYSGANTAPTSFTLNGTLCR